MFKTYYNDMRLLWSEIIIRYAEEEIIRMEEIERIAYEELKYREEVLKLFENNLVLSAL